MIKNCWLQGDNMEGYQQPLVVHILYHPDNASVALPYVNTIVHAITRDVNYPFSRGLDIPVFVWDDASEEMFHKHRQGERNIVFAITSYRTQGDDEWRTFIEAQHKKTVVLPLALDEGGLHLEGALLGIHAVRLYDSRSASGVSAVELATVQVLHELYRFVFEVSPAKRLKIFLSHAKAGSTGEKWALDVKHVIDSDTTLGTYFDCTDIQPGLGFAEEIQKAINGSALVLFGSDKYTSRHWCQREIFLAREHDCPMIAVDCREDVEDRIFPFVNNIPRVHVTHAADEKQRLKDAFKVVKVLLIEVIRTRYQRMRLECLQARGCVPANAIITLAPPDAYVLAHNLGKSTFVYPDPAIFPEEYECYARLGLEVATPFWRNADVGILDGARIGISISNPDDDELTHYGIGVRHLVELLQSVSMQLMLRGATLIYGGDLRKKDEHGFTEYLLDEACSLQKSFHGEIKRIENHLAWPLSLGREELWRWKSEYRSVIEPVSYEISKRIPSCWKLDPEIFLIPHEPKDFAAWAICLTEMREASIATSSVRICAGGRTHGYKGKMPGVLEEILIANRKKVPLLLIGGFGGIVGSVVRLLMEGEVDGCLTYEWQARNTKGYEDALKILEGLDVAVNYEEIISEIRHITIEELASRVNLSVDEYKQLMQMPFVDDVVMKVIQVMKGLKHE